MSLAPMLVAALCMFIATMVVLASARRPLGRCLLRSDGSRLQVGDSDTEIAVRDVRAWTIDGRKARVYTSAAGWKFVAELDHADELCALLVGVFGAPLSVARRGSRRARVISAAVAGLGIGAAAAGIMLEIPAFAIFGVPAFLFGSAFTGALSQKISKPRHH